MRAELCHSIGQLPVPLLAISQAEGCFRHRQDNE